MKFNKRLISYTYFIAVITIILAYFFLLQRPLNARVKKLLSTKKTLLEHKASIGAMGQNLIQLNQKIALLQKEIEAMENDFSKSLSPWDIMQNVDNIAKKLKLDISLVHPKMFEKTDDYEHSKLTVELKGNFFSLYRFLYQLEKTTLNLKADSLRIDFNSGTNQYQEEIRFDLYIPMTNS